MLQTNRYNINIMRQSACLVLTQITVNKFASLFKCNNGPDMKLFSLVGWGRSCFVCCLAHRGSTVDFLLLQCSSGVNRHPRDLQTLHVVSVESSSLFHHNIYPRFILSRDDPLMS